MPLQTPDAQAEARLCAAVKSAVDLVDSGMAPDAAIEKVARAENFGPGTIRTLAYGYNTGRQTDQWQTGQSLLDKLASFPLADPDRIVASIYGGAPKEKIAQALAEEYAHAPYWYQQQKRQKVAAAPIPCAVPVTPPANPYGPDYHLKMAYATRDRTKRACDELARRAGAAEDKVRLYVGQLTDYFKQASYNRLPFAVVEAAAHTYYDKVAPLLDMAYVRAHLREKRAADVTKPPTLEQPLNLQERPFSILRDCLKAAKDCHQARQAVQRGRQLAATMTEAAFVPFAKAGAAKPQADPGPWDVRAAELFKTGNWSKEVAAIAVGDIIGTEATHRKVEKDDPFGDKGDLEEELGGIDRAADKALHHRKKQAAGPMIGTAVGAMLGRTLGSTPKTKDDLVEDAWLDLEDPEHQNELRKIRAHAMLNQMMTDPEDPISAHSHDKVLRAYNELNQVAPRTAESAASLRPLLRKKLEGHTEPFEVQETANIEKGIAASRLPTPQTSLLHDTPDKILG